MNRHRMEPLAKDNPRRRIGGSGKPELMNISGNRKLFIYADTETFYHTNGAEPWKHVGEKNFSRVVSQMDVYPFIVA